MPCLQSSTVLIQFAEGNWKGGEGGREEGGKGGEGGKGRRRERGRGGEGGRRERGERGRKEGNRTIQEKLGMRLKHDLSPRFLPSFLVYNMAGEEFNYRLVPGSQHGRNQASENKVKYDCVKSLH